MSNRINVVFQLMDYEQFLLWPAVLMYELPFFQVATQKMYSLSFYTFLSMGELAIESLYCKVTSRQIC